MGFVKGASFVPDPLDARLQYKEYIYILILVSSLIIIFVIRLY